MRGKKNRITTGSMSVVCSEGNFLGGLLALFNYKKFTSLQTGSIFKMT